MPVHASAGSPGPAKSHSLTQISRSHPWVIEQRFCVAVHRDIARLHHVAPVGDAERAVGVLLHQQKAHRGQVFQYYIPARRRAYPARCVLNSLMPPTTSLPGVIGARTTTCWSWRAMWYTTPCAQAWCRRPKTSPEQIYLGDEKFINKMSLLAAQNPTGPRTSVSRIVKLI